MLSKVLIFVLRGFGKCINITKEFVIDEIGNLSITYFHLLLFGIFIAIVIRIINYLKQVQEVENENKGRYNALKEWRNKRK